MYNEKKEISNDSIDTYKKLKYSYNPEVTFELTKKEGGKKNKGWILAETNWNEN